MLRNFLCHKTYPKHAVFRIGPVPKILVIMICIHWLCKYDETKVDSVGVPMFWPDWQDQKMRQHQNHFWALGSSPPGPREGSLQIEQRMIYL